MAKVSVPGNGKLCRFREQKLAPDCGTVPACSGSPVLLAGGGWAAKCVLVPRQGRGVVSMLLVSGELCQQLAVQT